MNEQTPMSWARDLGYDVFTIPGPCGFKILGKAFFQEPDRQLITIFWPRDCVFWDYLLFHEAAHHQHLHTRQWSSQPAWAQEFEADMTALDLLTQFHDYPTFYRFQEIVRERFRALLETWIDLGITQHGELDAAIWAGCLIPQEALHGT